MDDALEQLLETWRTNDRINLFLIDRISDQGMAATLSKRGGRTVARQFAHLHNQRVYHLQGRTRALADGLAKIDGKAQPGKAELKRALTASGDGIAAFLEQAVTGAGAGTLRPFKKGIVANLAYLIAHESHHRGSILLTLKQCGHKLDKAAQGAIGNWDKM